MKLVRSFLALGAICAAPAAMSAEASANSAAGFEKQLSENDRSKSTKELPPYLQCVPFARELSGIQIYGDAHRWWDQAEGRYQRGNRPQVGAVMAFQPYRNMTLGHVAAVSQVIDSRTVLISHSNWSPIDGRRGQVERNVRAVDVSPNNDWTMVRVWYHPLQAIGTTVWPVNGFIYGKKAKDGSIPPLAETRLAQVTQPQETNHKPSKQFSLAFADLGPPNKALPARVIARPAPQLARIAQAAVRPTLGRSDPVRDAIARYEQ